MTNRVLACNFWLLTASPDHPDASQAWFQENGDVLPSAVQLRQWVSSTYLPRRKSNTLNGIFHPTTSSKPIQHYLLLPSYDWGISGWHFELIRPFVQKYLPTIGFSILEASQASKVTILGNLTGFPANTLDTLIKFRLYSGTDRRGWHRACIKASRDLILPKRKLPCLKPYPMHLQIG